MEATTNNYLPQYHNYFAMLEVFQMACRRTKFVKNKDGTMKVIEYFCITEQALKFLANDAWKFSVLELQSAALREIEPLLTQHNNNVDKLINKIHLDFTKIAEGFVLLNNNIDILSYTLNINESEKLKFIKTLRGKKRAFYYGCGSLQEWFSDFHETFIKIITPQQGQKNQNEALVPDQEKITGQSQQIETKGERLKNNLNNYGFFNLTMVSALPAGSRENLVQVLSSNKLPYVIAMFDYLGFIEHLKEHFPIKYNRNREISKWLNSDKDGRSVKANISCLMNNSTEDKSRYTAHLHKETVKKDYQGLK